NGVQAKTVDPGKKNRPLNATYKDRVLTVSLATSAHSSAGSVVAHMSVPVPLMSDCTRANAGTPASSPIALITATAPSRARFFILIPRKKQLIRR
ncbi:hypothetical protein, partial [Asanoa sp. NPDC050611]|uniref:hypothetical protein n=1 Tax=Asanoa sp. NPDC050611 TaxID=3157098 RepID=UPI0033DC837D